MAVSQNIIMKECFEGERERNCMYCPAHYSKRDGQCCFSQQFEADDPQCQKCPHTSACEPAFIRLQQQHGYAESAPRRIIVNPPPVRPPQTRSSLPVYGQSPAVRRGEGLIVAQTRPAHPYQFTEEDSFWKQMSVNAAWGAVEGALEMLLGFFRQRRPE